jgi:hypothetical protein
VRIGTNTPVGMLRAIVIAPSRLDVPVVHVSPRKKTRAVHFQSRWRPKRIPCGSRQVQKRHFASFHHPVLSPSGLASDHGRKASQTVKPKPNSANMSISTSRC